MSEQNAWPGETTTAQPAQAQPAPAGTDSATVTDDSQNLPEQYWTPRFRAADDAMARSAHLIASLPYRSAQYQAAVEADKHIEAEYNAAKAEALAAAQPGGVDLWPGEHTNDDIQVNPAATKPHGWVDELGIGTRSMLQGMGDVAHLGELINPFDYAENGVRKLLGYGPHQTAPEVAQSAADALGLPNAETDGEKLASAGVRGATGGLLMGGVEAAPVAMSALSGLGGGAAGELARQNGAGWGGQLAASLAGGVALPGSVAGAARVAQAIPGMAERTLSPTMQAFERQSVPALAADVGGAPAKVATAVTNSTLGTIPLHQAAETGIAATQAARGRIANNIGTVGDELHTGAQAQKGAHTWLDSTEAEAGRRYDAIPIEDDHQAVTDKTRAELPKIIQGLESNPDLSPIWVNHPRLRDTLEALTPKETAASRAADMQAAQQGVADAQSQLQAAVERRQLQPGIGDGEVNAANGQVQQAQAKLAAEQSRAQTPVKDGSISWADLKRLRTIVGKIIGRPGMGEEGPGIDALRGFYGALSDDMKATAQAKGPEAAVAFNRANAFWRNRQQTYNDVIVPILGKDANATPEQAFRQIQSWAGTKGSFVRTAQLFKALPEDEANAVRATLFDRLGNSSAGRQTAAGDAFSPAEMLTQWNKMDPRAKRLLFGGDRYQQDIHDILTIAEAQKSASKFANTSRTGLAVHAAPGIALLHSIPGLALQYGAGWILSRPELARWVASSVKKPNAAAQLAHIDRLTSLAARQPAIANDILSLQQRLREGFANGGPRAAAAQDQDGQQ